MLNADDLAYMRETQAEARPTEAQLRRRVQAPTASGGRSDSYHDPEPVAVRLDGVPANVPAAVVAVLGAAKAVKITMDLVDIRDGDTLEVSATEVYQAVTDSDPDRWATAQVIWAKRVKWPPRV